MCKRVIEIIDHRILSEEKGGPKAGNNEKIDQWIIHPSEISKLLK